MNPMHELAALIERTAETNGWTQAEVAKRATDQGHPLTEQNLSRIKREPVRTLVPKTIEALASGLQLPQPVVAAAALRSMGITVSASPPADATEAVKTDPRLSVRDKRIALGLLSELLADDEGTEGHVRSPAMNQAGGSPADELTQQIETQDVTFGLPTPEESEQGGSRDQDRQDRPESGPGAD